MNRIILSLLLNTCVSAQATQHPDSTRSPKVVLQVEIETDKSSYTIGEPIHFTTFLRNKGTAAVYIAKTFFMAAGGIAGFSVSIKQLTGKPSAACPVFADRFGEGSRTASQILQEDFLLLLPGGIVGYEAEYKGCDAKYEGTYQTTATYCACDLNTDRVKSAAERAFLITGELRSQPITLRVLEKRGAK